MSIQLLPGSSWELRSAATHLRSTSAELAVARRAAVRVEEITGGERWRGEGFDAFRANVERKPLPEAIDRAGGHMAEAASALDHLATRHDVNQETLRWCRTRLAALAGADASTPEAQAAIEAERQAILADADEAWADQRRALDVVADLFDRLDDRPMFATPPPSVLDRVGSFAYGVYEGGRDLVVATAQLAMLLNPAMMPLNARRAWNARDDIAAVARFAWNDPAEFGAALGRSLLDLDMLAEDPARWVGRRVPDILLTIATGGLGRVGTSAAMSVRSLRGATVGDRLVSVAGLGGRVRGNIAPLVDAEDAVSLFGNGSIAGQLNRLGADPNLLHRTGGGAFHRTDTGLGQIGQRIDQLGPVAATVRQLPGRINDEIRGVTSLPLRTIRGADPGFLLQRATGPVVQRHLDSVITDGWTGRLGIADGLLVGAPALSPATQASMAGVLGVSLADQLWTPVETFRDLETAAAQ